MSLSAILMSVKDINFAEEEMHNGIWSWPHSVFPLKVVTDPPLDLEAMEIYSRTSLFRGSTLQRSHPIHECMYLSIYPIISFRLS